MTRRINRNENLSYANDCTGLNITPQILLVLLAFCEKNIVRYGIYVLSVIPLIGFLSKFVLPVLYTVLILLCLYGRKKVGVAEIVVPTFMILAIAITCFIYPQNVQYITNSNNFWNSIFPCLRWYIVALIIIPDKDTMDLLGKVSCLSIAVESAFLILYMIPNNMVVSDDMNRAYQLLPNIMLTVNYALNRKKFVPWVFSVIGILYLLALGTRGPFLILTVYMIIKILRNRATSLKGAVIGVIIVGIIGGILSIPSIQTGILNWLHSLMSKMGLSTRIVDFMLEGNTLGYTAGRDDLFTTALQKISERPILGYGVYGEWQWFGWNTHNIYLELWIHFGVIIGSALLLWGILLVLTAYFRSTDAYAKDMILIFACFVFVRGFFGGSYLTYGTFFLIGLCIKEKRRCLERTAVFNNRRSGGRGI